MNLRPNQPFVFLDPQGRRWPRLRRLLLIAGVLLFIAIVWFVEALFVRPELRLPASVRKLKGQLKALQLQNPIAANPLAVAPWKKFTAERKPAKEPPRAKPRKFSEIRLGFYVDWDPNSARSLAKHAHELTHLCPEWMSLADGNGTIRFEEEVQLDRLVAGRGLVLMPMLNNLLEDAWQPEAVENLAGGPAGRRERFITELSKALVAAKAGGVVIDWEQMDPTYKDQITALLAQIADALHRLDKELWLLVPMNDEFKTYDLEALASHVDHFIAALYDETAESDAPGPIASEDWFEGWLEVVSAYGEPGQWIAAIGAYGYDWPSGGKRAETISFCDAMSRASYAGVSNVETKAPDYNPFYSYEETRSAHTVWFLDAVTFWNQLRTAREADLGGIAINRLGTEDPQLWNVLPWKASTPVTPAQTSQLETLIGSDTVTNVGEGEIVTVDITRDDGRRTVRVEEGGRLVESYSGDFPTYPVLYHQGAGGEHEVALTFDDGPDPKWTPQILDILKARGVKAAFFLVGRQAEKYPGLVERIVREGHEIGNHTYTHSNLAQVSTQQIRIELNATQRLIESITGRSTTLFRPPYNADSTPSLIEELEPLKLVQDELGYLIVLEKIDPEDWSRPGTQTIVERVKELRRDGSIVLLHDAGGNRQQTVAALPQIIDWLETRGDRIVSLSELLNIPRDDLMPVVARDVAPVARMVTGSGFYVWHAVEQFVWAFMIAATALIVLRTLLVAILAARNHRKTRHAGGGTFFPPLSIVIAALNEEKVIDSTLRSVGDTDYPGPVEIIVVDDGSSDQTAAQVRAAAAKDARIRLLAQPNGGKSEALRRGVAAASHEILVFLDADTHFDRATLRELVQPLADEKIGAVSGHAKVGNLRRFIARCQALEYTCGFNLDRRAYSEWNCITVAPGAVSALRKSAIVAAGGFSLDTLAEDTDLTLALHKCGYRIGFAPAAKAWTEAPETVGALARQRFRWAFGTLQCLWKHRDLIFDPRFKALGWFSLPSVWFFQIILVAITPIVDLLLLFSLLTGGGNALWYYFAIFLVTDLLLAFLACWLDGEKLRKAWIILPMRIIYRPLLSWVIWRALFRAVQGAWVTWGKLERTASVPSRA